MPGYRTGSFDAPKDLDKTTTPDNTAVFIPMDPPGAFNPMPDNNLLVWYDATSLSGTNGSSVTAWVDKSGNGNDLGPSGSGGGNPTLTVPGQNGLPVVAFSGTQCLQSAKSWLVKLGFTNPYSIISLTRLAGSINTDTLLTTALSNNNGGIFQYQDLFTISNAVNIVILRQSGVGLSTDVYQYNDGTSINIVGEWALWSWAYSGQQLVQLDNTRAIPWLYKNQILRNMHRITAQFTGVPSVLAANPTFVGGRGNGSQPGGFVGSLAELLVYNSVIPDAQRAAVETYLRHKWNF